MNDPLFGYSLDEINSNREYLKIVLINCSTNVKSYAKWFEINEIDKNEDSFTSYKVIYRLLPKDLNESIKELSVWKRFRDFKELYQIMYNHHVSLHRRDKFPEFVKSKFFGRFDEKVIEERKQCALKILQFIGSQAHLYRHEKFIEFLADGTFSDLAIRKENDKILEPQPIETKINKKNENLKTVKELNEQIEKFLEQNLSSKQTNYDFILDYLKKTKKTLDLVSRNENLKYHYASVKLLKSALDYVRDCINEIEINKYKTLNVNEKLKFLKDLNENVECLIEEKSKFYNLKIDLSSNDENTEQINSFKSKQETNIKNETLNPEPNYLNEWVLSDFNLKTYDFNNELSIMSGKLFDLSFNFKFVKILNNNCFLMKFRHQTNNKSNNSNGSSTNSINNNQYFILKRLQKSFNPNLITKSIVPFGNRIPYMCQLIKYYESDNTIFLLLEYYQLGRLYTHLNILKENAEDFVKNLNNIKKLCKQDSNDIFRVKRRNSLSTSKLNYSFCSSISNDNQRSDYLNEYVCSKMTSKRRTRSEMNDSSLTIEINHNEILKNLKEIKLADVKLIDETIVNNQEASACLSSSSLCSSSASSESDLKVVEFIDMKNKNNSNDSNKETTKSSKIFQKLSFNNILKLNYDSNKLLHPIALFKSSSSKNLSENKSSQSNTLNDEDSSLKTSEDDQEQFDDNKSHIKQVRLWLAQLVCLLKNLHEIGIICKDLNPNNLLINQSGLLVSTFFSKWNLVDDKLNLDAVNEYYVAPELCGLVNFQVTEACDWWSFGIIAYELLTLNKFSEVHSNYQVYINSINCSSSFKCAKGEQLIRQLLKINPSERLKLEQIQNHKFFSNIDWVLIENLFWKRK